MTRLPVLALILAGSAVAIPAAAQQTVVEGEKVNQVVVYGDDQCPRGAPDEILVCAKLPESERYRVPEMLRGNPLDVRNEAWANKVVAVERIGRFGTDSCSPTGLGGFTGCTQALVAVAEEQALAERQQAAEELERQASGLAPMPPAAPDEADAEALPVPPQG